MENMDKKIVKVVTKGLTTYGVVVGNTVITINGNYYPLERATWQKCRVSKEQRASLMEIYKNRTQIEKTRQDIRETEAKLRSLIQNEKKLTDDALKAFGFLNEKEAENLFLSCINPLVKKQIDEYDYKVAIIKGIFTTPSIEVCRTIDIEKWHDSCMVYREYDDTPHLDTTSTEAKKLANAYISKYSRPLSVKMKPEQRLGLGDKRWLYLDEGYKIDLKSLTAKDIETAAKNFK